MNTEQLNEMDIELCNEVLRYGNIIEDYSFRLGSENKRQYVIEYEGLTYYLTKTDGIWTYIYIKED